MKFCLLAFTFRLQASPSVCKLHQVFCKLHQASCKLHPLFCTFYLLPADFIHPPKHSCRWWNRGRASCLLCQVELYSNKMNNLIKINTTKNNQSKPMG